MGMGRQKAQADFHEKNQGNNPVQDNNHLVTYWWQGIGLHPQHQCRGDDDTDDKSLKQLVADDDLET